MHVRKHLVWRLYLCVFMCVHGGEDSPGAWQYGAVALQTPPVKTPPMGPGQLWPTYTDLWAISLVILTHL